MLSVRTGFYRIFSSVLFVAAMLTFSVEVAGATEPPVGPNPDVEARASKRPRPQLKLAQEDPSRRPPDELLVVLFHQYDVLRSVISKDIELTPEQARQVDEIFDRYRRFAKENTKMIGQYHITNVMQHKGRNPNYTPPQLDPRQRAQPLPVIPRALERVSEGRVIDGGVYEHHGFLIEDLIFLFNDHEKRERMYQAIKRTVALQRSAGFRDGPLTRVLRAVRDPALDIQPEFRGDLSQLVIDTMQRNARHRYKAEVMQPKADEMRSDIAKKLEPRQREHFLETLKMLEEEARLVERLIEEAAARKAESQVKADAGKKE